MSRVALFDGEVDYFNIVRFNLFGYIDEEVASAFINSLWEQDNDDQTSLWEVVLNTEGGDMESGTAIFSELRSYSERGGGTHHITTRVRGQAASCGSLILQAGDTRTAGKMDYIMLHEPLLSLQDATVQRVRDELEQADSWTENFIDVLMERATMERHYYSGHIAGRDWWLAAHEALTVGIIDEVI